MTNYIDGFVLPIAKDQTNAYRQIAEEVAKIWKEHGALDYREYAGDDMELEGTRSFTDALAATDDEIMSLDSIICGAPTWHTGADEQRFGRRRKALAAGSLDEGLDKAQINHRPLCSQTNK